MHSATCRNMQTTGAEAYISNQTGTLCQTAFAQGDHLCALLCFIALSNYNKKQSRIAITIKNREFYSLVGLINKYVSKLNANAINLNGAPNELIYTALPDEKTLINNLFIIYCYIKPSNSKK